MNSVPRKLTMGLAIALVAAACGDKVTVADPPPTVTPVVRSVVVSPSSATINAGSSFTFGAAVDADAGLTNAVTWTAAGGTGITVDQNGVATASATRVGRCLDLRDFERDRLHERQGLRAVDCHGGPIRCRRPSRSTDHGRLHAAQWREPVRPLAACWFPFRRATCSARSTSRPRRSALGSTDVVIRGPERRHGRCGRAIRRRVGDAIGNADLALQATPQFPITYSVQTAKYDLSGTGGSARCSSRTGSAFAFR